MAIATVASGAITLARVRSFPVILVLLSSHPRAARMFRVEPPMRRSDAAVPLRRPTVRLEPKSHAEDRALRHDIVAASRRCRIPSCPSRSSRPLQGLPPEPPGGLSDIDPGTPLPGDLRARLHRRRHRGEGLRAPDPPGPADGLRAPLRDQAWRAAATPST